MAITLCVALFVILLRVSAAQYSCLHNDPTVPAGVCICDESYCDVVEPLGSVSGDDVIVYTTAESSPERLVRTTTSFGGNPTGTQQVEIDATKTFQTIKGFGGAFTDAVAINANDLTPIVQKHLLESYYGEGGIGYSTGRVPMASCDFSLSEYTYDESPGDYQLVNFTIEMDLALKIPFIKAAMKTSVRPLSLFASPWSAPAWMKDNDSLLGGSLTGVAGGKTHKAWALYFTKFLDAYAEQGIPFWAVTVQNEPTGNPSGIIKWQEMLFTAEQEKEFVKLDLGPQLRQYNPDVEIMVVDDQRYNIPTYVKPYLNDSEALSYVSGIGVHWYGAINDALDHFVNLAETHAVFPQLYILPTEACEGYLPWAPGPKLGDWSRGETYGYDILNDLNAWAVGWTDWNIVLNEKGGPNWAKNYVDSPVIADTVNGTRFFKQPMFYYMAHFSKFLVPGSVRANSTLHGADGASVAVNVTAFVTPDKLVVVVVLNRGADTEVVSIRDSARAKELTVTMPPHSIKTLIYALLPSVDGNDAVAAAQQTAVKKKAQAERQQ